jgi:hypothetical protein
MITKNNMSNLFSKADASEYQTNLSQLQALLLACQQDLYHGLVEISYSPEEYVFLFFVEKKITSVYSVTSGAWKRIPVIIRIPVEKC